MRSYASTLIFHFTLLFFFVQCKEEKNPNTTKKTNKIDSVKLDSSFLSQPKLENESTFLPIKIKPAQYDFYVSPKTGELLLGDFPFQVGQKVTKDQLLFHIDKSLLFQKIKKIKSELKSKLTQFDYPNEIVTLKWKTYGQQLSTQDLFPEIPKIRSQEEKNALEKDEILELLRQGIDAENEIQSYYQLVKKSGTISKIFQQPGSMIQLKDSILSIEVSPTILSFQSSTPIKKTTLLTIYDKKKLPIQKVHWITEKKTNNEYTYTLPLTSTKRKESTWICIEN